MDFNELIEHLNDLIALADDERFVGAAALLRDAANTMTEHPEIFATQLARYPPIFPWSPV